MSSYIKRYFADDVVAARRPGLWIHAGDFNQAIDQAASRELQLQQRLTIADQRVDDLESELTKARELLVERSVIWNSIHGIYQSAPALKVDCGNCAFVSDVCITECESKKIRTAMMKP